MSMVVWWGLPFRKLFNSCAVMLPAFGGAALWWIDGKGNAFCNALVKTKIKKEVFKTWLYSDILYINCDFSALSLLQSVCIYLAFYREHFGTCHLLAGRF